MTYSETECGKEKNIRGLATLLPLKTLTGSTMTAKKCRLIIDKNKQK